MNVGYCFTRNLYDKVLPSIRSLLAHNKVKMLYIMCEDDELPFDIPCPHKIINVAGQTIFNDVNRNSRFTYMAMMRITFAHYIKADRIIYLDVDTIVCDSLKPIWEIDMTGKWWAAVQEYKGSYKPYGDTYYNSGVGVYNLKQIREDGIMWKWVNELNTREYRYTEQCVLNKFCVPDKVVSLPVRFNNSFCCGYTPDPAIVHFAGHANWWNRTNYPQSDYLQRWKDSPPG